jgi:hypothetical protein
MIGSSFLKSVFIEHGRMTATKIRKTIVAAMYNKISRLSMKSLTQTNSGKLITIVSGEIQMIERSLAILGILIAAPFINAVAYTVLGITTGW